MSSKRSNAVRHARKDQTGRACGKCGAQPEIVQSEDGVFHLALAHDATCPVVDVPGVQVRIRTDEGDYIVEDEQ